MFIFDLIGKVVQSAVNGFTFTLSSMAAKELAKKNGWFKEVLTSDEASKIHDVKEVK